MLRAVMVLVFLLVLARTTGVMTGPGNAAATVAPTVPSTPVETQVEPTWSYEGQAPDAAWRVAAAERIERVRKGDLRVIVTDPLGRPVEGARVRVAMQRHAFNFGAAVSSDLVLDDRAGDAHAYRKTLVSMFNSATPEHALTWPEHDRTPQRGRRVVEWLRGQGLSVRGQTMLSAGWEERRIPGDVARQFQEMFQRNPDGARSWLRGQTINRVRDAADAYAGQVSAWDVVSDPAGDAELLEWLGPEVMSDWFATARERDPRASLFITDSGILADGGLNYDRQDHFHEMIQALRRGGAPLDGIGLQARFGRTLTAPDRLRALLNRFGEFGLPIHITALDVEADDEQVQADYLRDAMTIAFSHPSVESVTLWGFWEGRHARPRAALFRKDWSPKPAGEMYCDLVFKQWWTDVSGTTDASGTYACRGFAGDYQVIVEHGETVQHVRTTLSRGGTVVSVVVR